MYMCRQVERHGRKLRQKLNDRERELALRQKQKDSDNEKETYDAVTFPFEQ